MLKNPDSSHQNIFLEFWPQFFAGLSVVVSLFVFYFLFTDINSVIDLKNGFIICRSDCTDYDRFSDYLSTNGSFVAVSADSHSSVQHRGFVGFVALVKFLFSANWQIALYAINVALLLIATKILTMTFFVGHQRWIVFGFTVLFCSLHLRFAMYSKFLLTDFSFGIITVTAFGCASIALARENKRFFIAAVLMSFVAFFWRQTGIFVVVLIAGSGFAWWLVPKRAATAAISLMATGTIAGFILVVGLSVYFGVNGHLIDGSWGSLGRSLTLLVDLNYLGDDYNPGFGTQVINFPYTETVLHDGSFWGTLAAVSQRFLRGLEIWIDQYSTLHNLYRAVLYSVLYGLGLLSVVYSVKRYQQYKAQALLFLFTICYVAMMFAVVGFEERYFSVFDFAIAFLSASSLVTFLQDKAKINVDNSI